MLNKIVIHCAVLAFICTPVTSEELQIKADSFIDHFYWYRKYLPLEDIAAYDVLRQMLIEAKGTMEFDENNNDLSAYIHELNNKLFEILDTETIWRDKKIDVLKRVYKSSAEIYAKIQELDEQYTENFNKFVINHEYPYDDSYLAQIDELYSQLITRLSYNNDGSGNGNQGVNQRTYVVKEGDYLRKIAQDHYGDEMLWPFIFVANTTMKDLFIHTNPNPDWIYPGAEIVIPSRPQRER